MNFVSTGIPDLYIIEPKVFCDQRGYFFESFNKQKFIDAGLPEYNFIQDNESKSVKGVVRGLHYQIAPYSQAKLVRVLHGSVYDVAVDLRKSSPTFGKWFGLELNDENKKQLLIPRGFAHGFSVLSETAVFSYKCDNLYHPASERGISLSDLTLKIDWQTDLKTAIISDKDKCLPCFHKADISF